MSNEDIIWVASFDIGYRNLAFCVEECNRDAVLQLQKIPRNEQYNIDGSTTAGQAEILRQVCRNSKTILLKNTDLTNKPMKVLEPEVFHTLTDLLDEYHEYWDQCDVFILERQMSFKGVYNVSALKLGQHCWSYFGFKYGRFKEIVEFPAYHKTQVLGAPKVKKKTKTGKISYRAMDKPPRKKWAVDKATSILVERNDFKTLSELQSMKKKDDASDCILQSVSAMYLILVEQCI